MLSRAHDLGVYENSGPTTNMIADSGLSTQELVVKMVMTHVDDALPQLVLQGTRFEPSTLIATANTRTTRGVSVSEPSPRAENSTL